MIPDSDEPIREHTDFDFPRPPAFLPVWAEEAGHDWIGLNDDEIVTLTNIRKGKYLEICREELPPSLWGFHIARSQRVRIMVNSNLPPFWRRFALFHELFHVLEHRRGEEFWNRTATPMSSFETQADLFAWAVILKERNEEIPE